MKRTVTSIVIMILAAIAGMFFGALFNTAINGMILGVLVSGIACIIYAIDTK